MTCNTERHVGFVLGMISHRCRCRVDEIVTKYGITGVQSRILVYIDRNEDRDVFQRDIENKFGIRRSSVTSVIDHLEKGGFVKRESVSHDARLKKLTVTKKAKEVNSSIGEEIDTFEKQLLNGFSEAEENKLFEFLQRIKNNVDS